MNGRTDIDIGALARRACFGVFVSAFGKCAFVLAAVFATTILTAHLFGKEAPWSWWWAAALILPIAYGASRGYAARPSAGGAAAWIDRKAGLGGLLVSLREADGAAWEKELARRTAAAPAVKPRVGRRVDLYRVLGAATLLAAVAFLPAPSAPPGRTSHPAISAAVEELKRTLEELKRHDALDPKTEEEIERRLGGLEERLREGDNVAWSDVDMIESRMEAAKEMKQQATDAARDTLEAVAAADPKDEDENRAAMAAALEKAGVFGALDKLPQDIKDRLGAALGKDGEVDADALPSSPEDLQKLAEDIADALASDLGDLAAAGLADLDEALADAEAGLAEWEEAEEAHEHGPECEGGT